MNAFSIQAGASEFLCSGTDLASDDAENGIEFSPADQGI
jgi:hypothetical protein